MMAASAVGVPLIQGGILERASDPGSLESVDCRSCFGLGPAASRNAVPFLNAKQPAEGLLCGLCLPDCGREDEDRCVRPSRYLNAVEIGDGRALLYNGLSMCIDVVPSTIARLLLAAEGAPDLSFLLPEEKEHLAKRGHLTDLSEERERAAMLEFARAIGRRGIEAGNRSSLVKLLTFILTYRCNLSCSYCFQNEIRQTAGPAVMSEAFIDRFFEHFLARLFPDTPRNKFRIILFGGEPLLPGNRGPLERILRYAGKYGVVVSASTNATTVPKMLDLVGPEPGKIQNVQVTLDGERAFHDTNRVSRSGRPTFDDVIHAVRELVRLKARANIRVHLHPNRLESTESVVSYLDRVGLLGNGCVEIYFAPVHSFHAYEMSSSDLEVFSRLFLHVALKQKTPPIQNFDFLHQILDTRTLNHEFQPRYCAVSSGLHYAVDPEGDLYECLEEAGRKDRRIGKISGDEIEYFELGDIYRKSPLESRPECLQCSIASFCGGGCISRTRTQGDPVFSQFCMQNKVFVGQTLRACYLINRDRSTGT